LNTSAIRQAIRYLEAAFLADLQALPADAWQKPSDCDGWTVAGAFIHIIQVAELLGDSLARGRAGDPGPPPLAAAEGVQAWRAARTARQQQALTQSPAELFAWYDRAGGAINAELDAIPGAPPDARGWHPVGAQPLAWVQRQWLFEMGLHDWDIRVALDPSADIRASVQPALARTLPERLGRGFNGADDPALSGAYRIEMSGDPDLAVTILVGDGAVTVATADDGSAPTATISTDPAAFALVMTNRRPVEQFVGAGRWSATGDTARAAAFANAFKSY
jgi:uncharacterized protein (TIGR03083 family)